MNVARLQKIDRWVGVPLCWVLTLFHAVFGRRPPAEASPPRSILFVKLAEQGSTVLAHAALKRAVEIAGRQNVYFITFEDNRFILDVLEVIPPENVIAIPFEGAVSLTLSSLRALQRIRGLKLDAAVDMEFFSRGSAALTWLSGARSRAGFHAFFGAGPYRGNLMTHRLLYNPHLHTSQTFFSLVESLLERPDALPTFGFKPATTLAEPPQFAPSEAERARIRELVRRETGGAPRLILLNSNASDLLPLRKWPAERYVELGKRLLAEFPDVWIGFTGSPSEADAGARLAQQTGPARCVSFAGKTTLRELLVLYTLADVLVSNDSGPAHFATLTPIRVVTLFGPETPALFAALTPRNTVLWAGIACSPCVSAYNNRQSPCRNNVCMQSITVDQVFTKVCAALKAGESQKHPDAAGA